MSDRNEIIDVEAEEIVESDNLPAVVDASNSERMELPNRQDALLADNPDRRCVATNSRGERCRKFAIYGSTVCRTHGGAVKRIREAARIRVENTSNRLMSKLIEFAFDDTKPPDVQLRAIRDSLDRAGLKAPAEVVLSQGETKPYEAVFDVIGGNPSDATDNGNSAGDHSVPPAKVDLAADQPESSSHAGPLQQPRPRDFDREKRGQPRQLHITGEAAMRLANEANRQAGVFEEQRAIEGPHKRYRRP